MKTVVVLGIQRSATSLVAKGLEQSGDVWFEPFSAAHWDNYEIYRINNNILADAGGREFAPPPHEDIMRAGRKYEGEIASYVSMKEQEAQARALPFWGFKISNTGWTVDLWHPHFTEPHYVYVQRPPDVVASRLVHYGFLEGYRAKMRNQDDPLEYATDLVDEYNARVLAFLTRQAQI